MAIRLSEPLEFAPRKVLDEVQDAILRRGGSSELARIVTGMNEYARDKGDENRALRDALKELRAENSRLRAVANAERERIAQWLDGQGQPGYATEVRRLPDPVNADAPYTQAQG